MYNRRSILRGAGAAGLGGVLLGGVRWSRADAAETRTVRAILLSATHDTLAVKVLLETPPSAAPAAAAQLSRCRFIYPFSAGELA